MAEVCLDGVTKVFGDRGDSFLAVGKLSMGIDDGECVAVTGPTGCGKSLLLRMVAGIDAPTGGEVRIDGEIVDSDRTRHGSVAVVSSLDTLLSDATVRENVTFGLTTHPDEEIDEHVHRAARLMDFEGILDRTPDELSDIERRRVAIGRAIVSEPSVLLCDDPLAALDEADRADVQDDLVRVGKELGATMLYGTGDPSVAVSVGDRVAVLHDGELGQIGTPTACYHQPATLSVARILGDPPMNLMAARKEGEHLVIGDLRYRVSRVMRGLMGRATTIVVGIRPENVALGVDPDEPNVYPATVEGIRSVGDGHEVSLRPANAALELVATVDDVADLELGEETTVGLPTDIIHLFDGRTGEALKNPSLESVGTE